MAEHCIRVAANVPSRAHFKSELKAVLSAVTDSNTAAPLTQRK